MKNTRLVARRIAEELVWIVPPNNSSDQWVTSICGYGGVEKSVHEKHAQKVAERIQTYMTDIIYDHLLTIGEDDG